MLNPQAAWYVIKSVWSSSTALSLRLGFWVTVSPWPKHGSLYWKPAGPSCFLPCMTATPCPQVRSDPLRWRR